MAKAILDRYVNDRRRRNEHRRVGLMFTIFGGIIIVAIAFVFRTIILSPALAIQSIKAEGIHYLSSSDVTQLAIAREFRHMSWFQSLATPRNIFSWRTGVLSGEPDLPAVKKLSVTRDIWQRTIKVTVEEREPYGIWCQSNTNRYERGTTNKDTNNYTNNNLVTDNLGASATSSLQDQGVATSGDYHDIATGRCWWFDEEGVLFRQALAAEGGTIRVVRDYTVRPLKIGTHVLPPEFLSNLSSVFKAMTVANVPLGEVRLEDLELQEVSVFPSGLARIYFSLRFPADNTVAGLTALEERPGLDKLQYVDFRVENKVYYK